MNRKIKELFRLIYEKLFKINDSTHRIALGAGIGVFSGLLPGTGPIAALFFALIFRANRAAALIGSALTNTWLSFLTFILALKIGCVILNVSWQFVKQSADNLIRNFSFAALFKLSFTKVILPLLIGYIVVGLILGLISYAITYLILRRVNLWKRKI